MPFKRSVTAGGKEKKWKHTSHLVPQDNCQNSRQDDTQKRHGDDAGPYRQAAAELRPTKKELPITEGHGWVGLEDTKDNAGK